VDRNKTDFSAGSLDLTISNLSGTVSQMVVEFWNTDPDQTGPIQKSTASVSGGSMSILVPEFEQDLAIRFYSLSGNDAGEPDIVITGLGIDPASGIEAGDTVTFSATAVSETVGTIYYRFDLVPNYGTSVYDPYNNWTMIQDFSTSSTCSYTFSEENDYIVVVYASSTPSIIGSVPTIIGASVTVGDSGTIDMQDLSLSPPRGLTVGDTVTFTVNGASRTGENLYYRFDLVPHYGSDRYDPYNNWKMIRNFSTQNTFSYRFENIGEYIVVVYASSSPSILSGASPIAGGVVHIGAGH
jgi:hypothetical protein